MEDQDELFSRIFTVVLIIVGFVLSVSLVYYYIHENFMGGSSCSCSIPVYWVLASLSTIGILVGIFVYAYLEGSFRKERKELHSEVMDTLNFLKDDEKRIVEILIKSGGRVLQKDIVELSGFNKVKVSRCLSRLEDKSVVSRRENGMSKKVVLEEPFDEIFCGTDI